MREIKIIAAAEDAGARIDKYISEQEDLSRSRVQALLAEGSILVNQNAVKANYKVKADDCITAVFNDEMEMEARPEKMELDVRYEDEDVIVINKPKNIVVHPAAGNQSGTHLSTDCCITVRIFPESMVHCVRESCIALIRIQRDC